MQNIGTTLLKITALAGGAFLGMILTRRFDEALSTQANLDKNRYAQGLQATPSTPTTDESSVKDEKQE